MIVDPFGSGAFRVQVHPDDPWAADRGFQTEVFVATYQRRRSQREALNALPLYPSEALLWDEGQIPSQSYSGARPLALMKLNLQFLTPVDYLLRNFHLFRLEAAYEVREDIAVGGGGMVRGVMLGLCCWVCGAR